MAYCTLDDITKALEEATLIQLTDDENLKPTAIDPANAENAAIIARIDEAIETADAEIDGYCAVKYSVPLSPVPPVVNKLSVDLAIYYLYSRRSMPEKVEKRYERAIARLKDIARGLLSLGVDPEPAASVAADSAQANKATSDRVFTRDSLKGF
jgi:phage gp36-like protein